MHNLQRVGITIGVLSVIGMGLVPTVAAQSGKKVGDSLCDALKPGQVREAFDVRMKASADAYACYWSTVDVGDPERGLVLSWHHVPTFEALKALSPDDVELLIGARPALWNAVNNSLSIGLEPGVLVMSARDLQGTDWQGALTTLGESVTARSADLLTPPAPDAALLALLPPTLGDQGLLVSNLWVDKEFPAGDGWSGDALRKALKKAGYKASDVSIVSAQLPDASAGVSALQVKGGDATGFVPAVLTYQLGQGWTSSSETFTNGAVTVVGDAQGSISEYVYPKDDVVWVVRAEEPALTELLAKLPGAPTVPAPAPEPVVEPPVGEIPAGEVPAGEAPAGEAPAGDVDVAAVMPTTVGGVTLQQQASDVGGFLAGKTLKVLNKALKATGKDQADLQAVLAQAPDGSVVIVAIDVDGADASAYLAFMQEVVLSGLPSRKHTKETGEVAGKTVTLIHPAAAKAGQNVYLYASGDVIWMVAAQEPDLSEVFAALP